jgi:F-type H+-transporting ATPase subunit delta
MSQDAIGRRYARAIFELARDAGQGAAVADQLARFADVYASSNELSLALQDPMVGEPARLAIVSDIAARITQGAAADLTRKAIAVITQNRRIAAIGDIARNVRKLVDESDKVVRAQVTSATPLSDAYLSQLKAELEKATGGNVVVVHSVDASLIAGVITQIGDRVVDGSLRTRLRTFRESSHVTS